MKIWENLRISLLVLTFGGVVIVLGKSILEPQKTTEQVVELFTFPAIIPLPGWQHQESEALTEPWGNTYRYQQNDKILQIEMRYVDHPHPNEKLFRQYDPRDASVTAQFPTLTRTNNTGSYSLSVDNYRVYLRSCINPRSPSAITYEQFIQNRYTYDLHFSRLIPVIMGAEPLRDHRCLWSHLSLPISNNSFEETYPILEEVWQVWYQWWHPRFPRLER
ncbi:MAG: cyanoexosortase A system-associated protein [Limnospira sp. PMC 1291.21]|uniref:Cyanoexosortase A system-associated protein n=3 Tax=Limnospira TaxID=2596745 RepID=A0A9P1KE26_9CYAN|nr:MULTISPECIES: cyanoexosortase A system-associated protein [Limnospira]MDC0837180.1 cyanoexosortase A system-associated protein [Limnoraphis robusta]MDY7055424.1 cyanoexosortase A system-associated protein [Limnospira fusiformis LS22]QJB27212.1 cyanoexosortase A system-associated protein [Limnospira fusiformis SAG 85.79]EDZ93870.1 conserved hypothetical protein [Limnospira maxima CS-328]MDT9179712.1 cyanoexosortase A system-associated protein [Limnospira sp. PMC 1238.20]